MEHKKSTAILSKLRWTFGGEQGIRTLETLLTFTRFPIVLLRPTRTSLRWFADVLLKENGALGK